jgi:hypothetical protein
MELNPVKMQRFLVYEEYAAHSDLFTECSAALRNSNTWPDTELGIEALSSLTISMANRESDSHKALSFADLVVKVLFIYRFSFFFC